MDFTANDVQKFQSLYLHHFGVQVDDLTANHKLAMLVRQIELTYCSITPNEASSLKDVHEYANTPESQQLPS